MRSGKKSGPAGRREEPFIACQEPQRGRRRPGRADRAPQHRAGRGTPRDCAPTSGLPHVRTGTLKRETPRGLGGTEPSIEDPLVLKPQASGLPPNRGCSVRPARPPPDPLPAARCGKPARRPRTHSWEWQKLRGKPEGNVCLTLSEPSRGGGCRGRQHQAQAEDGGCCGLSLHGAGAGSSGAPGCSLNLTGRTGPA